MVKNVVHYMKAYRREKHRYMRPLEAYLELVQDCGVDKVLIGDISGRVESVQEIASASRGIIPLRYEPLIEKSEVLKMVEQVHTNRLDPARDVIRSVQSREEHKVILQPMNAILRKAALQLIMNCTVDMQEMQVAIHDLPADESERCWHGCRRGYIFIAVCWCWKNVSTFVR